ncbi:MAG: EamA family transporter [Denitrovibrio sp.]|nr:MAG: EamA family transporter [Denitrovibrio sp.]
MTWFIFIIFSALSHSLWNILLKKSENKYAFNFYMHLVNITFFTILYPIFFSDYLYMDYQIVLSAFVAALFFTGYHLAVSTSYRYADVSLVYPITTSSPFFILVWAVLFLKEDLTFVGVFGIIVTILGTILLNKVKNEGFKLTKGVAYAFLAAFLYSFGALVYKKGVSQGNFILYVYCMSFFMTSFLYLFSRKSGEIKFSNVKKDLKLVIIGGVIVFASFTTYRYGLTMVELSYATALRQINVMFGAVLGMSLFGEKFTFNKLLGTFVIMIGVMLIKIGM